MYLATANLKRKLVQNNIVQYKVCVLLEMNLKPFLYQNKYPANSDKKIVNSCKGRQVYKVLEEVLSHRCHLVTICVRKGRAHQHRMIEVGFFIKARL